MDNERLTQPHPERIAELSFYDGQKVCATLELGLQLTRKTRNGLKILPTYELYFDLDGKCIELAPGMARTLAQRILEFCVEAEARNKRD